MTMEKLSQKDREALQKAKNDLLKSLDDYLDSCIFLHDTKRFRRFTKNVAEFMRKEVERLRLQKLDIDIQENVVEIREDDKVYYVEIMRDKDGSIWGVYPDKELQYPCLYRDNMRNLLILFKKGILKLEDFQRKEEAKNDHL